ncbi:uncharacterized protein LOC142334840 [Convolutriloba macropyga]|uniref:uncharacterized protein LOC142334840 n=1 Tax=Convolutriloba macropyga TaxID=536237 RepID=UPI003F51FDE2
MRLLKLWYSFFYCFWMGIYGVAAFVPYVDFEAIEQLTQSDLSLLFPVDEITGRKDSIIVDTVFKSQALAGTTCGDHIEIIFQCIFHVHQNQQEEEAHKKRSFQIIDAWGKTESGITQGNLNWLGRPSLCKLTFQVDDGSVSYTFDFLASIVQFKLAGANYTNPLKTKINIVLCLPADCQAGHLMKLFNVSRSNFQGTLEPLRVYFEDNGDYNVAFILAVIVLGVFLILVIAGDIINYYPHVIHSSSTNVI